MVQLLCERSEFMCKKKTANAGIFGREAHSFERASLSIGNGFALEVP